VAHLREGNYRWTPGDIFIIHSQSKAKGHGFGGNTPRVEHVVPTGRAGFVQPLKYGGHKPRTQMLFSVADVTVHENGFVGRYKEVIHRGLPQQIEFRTESTHLPGRERSSQPLLDPYHERFLGFCDLDIQASALQLLSHLMPVLIGQFLHDGSQGVMKLSPIFRDL
jgi:hypothetical protein